MTRADWTPASRAGLVPLHPLGFGTILGRSFVALRHNPRVLLGFALVVQAVSAILMTIGLVAVAVAAFSRLASLTPGSEEYETVMAGSIALIAIVGFVATIITLALAVIVQGVVVADVAHAVVAERLSLARLWQRVRPAAGRLIGYGLLITLAILIAVALLVGAVIGVTAVAGPVGIAVAVLLVIAAIPVSLWITTKLMLVPAVLVLERTDIRRAVARSWTLIRGRFWVGLGVSMVISMGFGALAQVVSIPSSIASMGVTTIVSPTGEGDVSAIVAFLIGTVVTQLVIFLLQCISIIVLSTASGLVYVDCRMRREGLDLDLLAYVDQRDAGSTDLPDPYLQHIGRSLATRWAPPTAWLPPQTTWAPPQTSWAPPAAPAAPAPRGQGWVAPADWAPPSSDPDAGRR